MRAPIEKLPAVVEVLRRFGARRIFLFGSAAGDPEHAQDVDLAVEGIPLRSLLAADAAAFRILDYPMDLVSKEDDPAFYEMIRLRGKVLYEQGCA
ncbi:MAG: nucleotidyltransferase domain-containing protein [Planctomycetota bacterium]|nr:nucleotidyltransferase domain-containing protein [Planctomycetota bacterium]